MEEKTQAWENEQENRAKQETSRSPMAILFFEVDPVEYKVHIDRIRNLATVVLNNTDTVIKQEKAIQLIQMTLLSLNHKDHMPAGKKLVDTLVDLISPSDKDFKNLDDLIEKLSKKITSKHILDETQP